MKVDRFGFCCHLCAEDQGILVGDASRHLNIETPNNDGICKENRHNAAAKITQGYYILDSIIYVIRCYNFMVS